MKLLLMYTMIIITSLIILTLIKEKYKALKILGITTITTSVLIILLIFIANIILKNNINFINISIITNYLLKQFARNSLYLAIIGIIELILSKYIYLKQNKTIVNYETR